MKIQLILENDRGDSLAAWDLDDYDLSTQAGREELALDIRHTADRQLNEDPD